MSELEIRPVSLEDDFEAQLDLGQRAFGRYSEQQKVTAADAALDAAFAATAYMVDDF